MGERLLAFFRSPNAARPALLVTSIALAFSVGFLVRGTSASPASLGELGTPIRDRAAGIHTNPLLLCDTPVGDFDEYQSLKQTLNRYLSSARFSGAVTTAVYFRSLNSGRWMGINENERFSPASLLKVPVMIAYFRLAENHPEVLSNTLVYDGSFDGNAKENFRSPYDITPGAYRVDDLLKAMIVNSDNNALKLLEQNANPSDLTEIFTDLGLPAPPSENGIDFLSAKNYSYFFRLLYNATYLDRDYSERAINLLLGPDFPQGLKAGVPVQVEVAQKFGEQVIYDANGAQEERELHDCGIVYAPVDTYLLCVMTKSADERRFDDQLSIIQTVSRLTYSAVSAR